MAKCKLSLNDCDHKGTFIKTINSFAGKHSTYQLFRDFVALAARTISNQKFHFQQTLEDEYLAIVKKYTHEELDKFCKLFALTTEALNHYHDFLGHCYMALNLGNDRTGQFFTPYHVCQLMSSIQIGNLNELPKIGFISVLEPTVGAGGMLIAFAEMFIQQGYRPETQMFCKGIDIDPFVAEMAYIQLAMLNIPAQICIGDSLSNTVSRSYYTPAYARYNWYEKLNKLSEPIERPQESKDVKNPDLFNFVEPVLTAAKSKNAISLAVEQFDLF